MKNFAEFHTMDHLQIQRLIFYFFYEGEHSRVYPQNTAIVLFINAE